MFSQTNMQRARTRSTANRSKTGSLYMDPIVQILMPFCTSDIFAILYTVTEVLIIFLIQLLRPARIKRIKSWLVDVRVQVWKPLTACQISHLVALCGSQNWNKFRLHHETARAREREREREGGRNQNSDKRTL